MKSKINSILVTLLGLLLVSSCYAQNEKSSDPELDKKVEAFLKDSQGAWRDMNVPASDGKLLYDLIVKNNYTQALEIGTSTGHSGIWIAWALSKTGGKLITIDISESRHKEALENFKKAGLEEYIDARLGDAHELVQSLRGHLILCSVMRIRVGIKIILLPYIQNSNPELVLLPIM